LFTTRAHPPPSVFNVQQQFEIECIEMIERFVFCLNYSLKEFKIFFSETFQRVLIQIIDQSFTNIYDEFAREIAKSSTTNSTENNL